MDKDMRLIETVTDIARLTPEEFERFLPDLVAWHHFANIATKAGAEMPTFTWCDDGKAGELHSVTLIGEETGEKIVIKGSAYNDLHRTRPRRA